jgi:hypothetical protein
VTEGVSLSCPVVLDQRHTTVSEEGHGTIGAAEPTRRTGVRGLVMTMSLECATRQRTASSSAAIETLFIRGSRRL